MLTSTKQLDKAMRYLVVRTDLNRIAGVIEYAPDGKWQWNDGCPVGYGSHYVFPACMSLFVIADLIHV